MSTAPNINRQRQALLRSLPSVSALLEHEEVRDWLNGLPRSSVVAALQSAVQDTRERILSGEITNEPDSHDLLARAEADLLVRSMPSLRRVVNATGIVLHTGLGRAPLCDAAIEAIVEGASGYCNLEWDLSTGARGSRSAHARSLITSITGAEAATVVNNNAAATLMILRTFAAGKEVIVSRGQLIEIGGSFRLPEIFEAGGAILREVGTTNRTRLSDYEKAITDRTAIIMRVHPSNYRVVGFTEETSIAELAELAHQHNLIAVDDLGSGALIDFADLGLPDEPCVRASIEAGADLACFSGDKLVGGPQAGIIVGKQDLIARIEKHPLMRTYRVDKLTLLALEATLRHYLDLDEAIKNIPTLSMLRASTDELARRARELADQLAQAIPGEHFFVCSDVGFAGGGSLPAKELQTVVVQWRPEHVSVALAMKCMREAEVPVIARVRDDAICLDLRTLRDGDFEAVVDAIITAASEADDPPRSGISLPII